MSPHNGVKWWVIQLERMEEKMAELQNMTREELLEVIRIKDILIQELREDIEAFEQLAEELQAKQTGK